MIVENNLLPIQNTSFNPEKITRIDQETKGAFESFYEAAIDVVNQTNAYQHISDNKQLDFVTGKTDDFLSVILAQEKAYSSLNFTTQVTNKLIDAYREIMRMQL